MYSWEIEQLLKLRNYLLDVKEYFEICDKSPQITRVSYNPYDDNFTIETSDNYKLTFKVRSKR